MGLDATEHGLPSAYADFVPAVEKLDIPTLGAVGAVPKSRAIDVKDVSSKGARGLGKAYKNNHYCQAGQVRGIKRGAEPNRRKRHDGNPGHGLRRAEG